MSDPTARWLTDPTGRHDHRYWDGTGWTDHVADAGIPGTDPYEALPPPPPPLPPPPPDTEPVSTAEPEAPTAPEVTEPDTPTEPIATTDVGAAVIDEASPAEDPTLVTVIDEPSPAEDPTEVLPVAEGGGLEPNSPMPPLSPTPVPSSSRAGLAIGVALLAVVAIVIALVVLVGGDDGKDNSAAAISRRMADKLQQEEGLRTEDARCVADRLVDELGTDRLEDVDLDADQPPKDLQDDINEAFPKAITACHVGGPSTFEHQSDLDSYLEQLTNSFLSMYGLTAEQAQCLAQAMTPAIGSSTSLDDAFGQFREDLAACGITDDDLRTPAG